MTQKLKFLFALLLIFSLNACDEDDEPSSSTELIGTWEAQSFSFSTESATSVSGVSTTVTASGMSTAMDYTLEFTGSTFTTSGEYSYSISTEVSGIESIQVTESVTDVSGSGTYSTSSDVITTNGSFFELTSDGIDLSTFAGEQKANYEIQSDGTLVFTQNEETTTTTQGITTTSIVISTSTWVKQ